ncbi:MAG: hypothetical protein OHK0012_18180 [Synechococcales cyanobacterium]
MKVLLLGNYLPDGQESMQRFTHMLDQALRDKGIPVSQLQPPVVWGSLPAPAALKKWLGYIDKFILFPQQLEKAVRQVDFVHVIDQANAVYVPHLGTTPYLVTCHDLMAIQSALGDYPENPTGATGKIYQRWILSSLKKARWIACVSEYTQKTLLSLIAPTPHATYVVPNGLNFSYQRQLDFAPIVQSLGVTQPYILHVGGNLWYKNRLGMIRIFDQLLHHATPDPILDRLTLVMVGKPFTPEMTNYVQQHGLGSRILSLVNVSNPQLEALYSGAEVFVFPSLMEGFGWPIIEAQACGCAVVCGDAGPLPEVAGAGALMASAKDERAMAEQVRRLLTEPSLRQQVVAQGTQNVERFRPQTMIDRYVQLYETILAGSQHP